MKFFFDQIWSPGAILPMTLLPNLAKMKSTRMKNSYVLATFWSLFFLRRFGLRVRNADERLGTEKKTAPRWTSLLVNVGHVLKNPGFRKTDFAGLCKYPC